MKRALWASGLLALAFLLGGCLCTRSPQEKLTRRPRTSIPAQMMACPKCGAPQKPYRVNACKSYYRCSGQPPKFLYHPECSWSHNNTGEISAEK